jgi:hypothetical protein
MKTSSIKTVYDRIYNSIMSSVSLLQLETAERMVELFRKQNTQPELSEKLDAVFVEKAKTLHYFDWKKFRDFGQEAA